MRLSDKPLGNLEQLPLAFHPSFRQCIWLESSCCGQHHFWPPGGTHGQGGAAGQDVAGVMKSFEGLPLNVGIRRSRGRRVLVGPLGGLVSENFLRSLLTPQQVDAFRGRVYAMNHTVLLAPTTRSSCDGSGDQSAAGIARGEAAMCPPAVPLNNASHAVRRRVRRRLLTSAARREQQRRRPRRAPPRPLGCHL